MFSVVIAEVVDRRWESEERHFARESASQPTNYKVYNNCEDGIGKDGKVGCYLHFYCLDWNTDDLGSDC